MNQGQGASKQEIRTSFIHPEEGEAANEDEALEQKPGGFLSSLSS